MVNLFNSCTDRNWVSLANSSPSTFIFWSLRGPPQLSPPIFFVTFLSCVYKSLLAFGCIVIVSMVHTSIYNAGHASAWRVNPQWRTTRCHQKWSTEVTHQTMDLVAGRSGSSSRVFATGNTETGRFQEHPYTLDVRLNTSTKLIGTRFKSTKQT